MRRVAIALSLSCAVNLRETKTLTRSLALLCLSSAIALFAEYSTGAALLCERELSGSLCFSHRPLYMYDLFRYVCSSVCCSACWTEPLFMGTCGQFVPCFLVSDLCVCTICSFPVSLGSCSY